MSGIFWIASYPRSGNTWVRLFVANLLADGGEPADINQLNAIPIASSRLWLDAALGVDTADLKPEEIDRVRPDVYGWTSEAPVVQYRKIHDANIPRSDGEPLISRRGTLGALYIVRDPRDVAVSTAHHFSCTFDVAIDYLADPHRELAAKRDGLARQVRQRLHTWSDHAKSWVDDEQLQCEVVRYEDLVRQPLSAFARVAAFLQLAHDPKRVGKAIRYTAFEELQDQERRKGFIERPAGAASFFRRGVVGHWRDCLTPRQVDRIFADHGETMTRFGYLPD